jgi:pimeloyl-ACP methyl ester carboxylesterase
LHDYAADVALVIRSESRRPVLVVGHAFGNAVARTVAADYPELVHGVALVAGLPGKNPPNLSGPMIAPEIRAAIDTSGDLSQPEEARLKALQQAFFAPGHNPRVWLSGWYPAVQKQETRATGATPIDDYFAAGKAPILEIQAEEDAAVPKKFSEVLRDQLGDRVTVRIIPDAAHAVIAEQPDAVASALIDFARQIGLS